MTSPSLYPQSPVNVPEGLTTANVSYKKHAIFAMLGLMLFMAFYLFLIACFAYTTFQGVLALQAGYATLFKILTTGSSFLLTIFLVKSLFAIRKYDDPNGIEVSQSDEPQLFDFLHQLADEVGAPKPHRVFITPDVNAAVFYDLSLLNFIFPSKKNLIVGLGLVNVLRVDELKAVLAHEFGHFAQGSMLVGRWVYIAQQIISHMVATRDWFDSAVRFVSRFDIRIAWIGWILSLIIWSIRSLMDTFFSLVIMAERALSREMEFNADLVAVSVTGSDPLINALHKLQAADHAWQTALDVANTKASQGHVLEDLFKAQKTTIDEMRRVLDDQAYGATPELAQGHQPSEHRVFSQESARPPQMWATHPANRDREDNAKSIYVASEYDERDAWVVFADAEKMKRDISLRFYNQEKTKEMSVVSPLDAVLERFNKAAYSPKFRGVYLNRSPVRNFANVDEIINGGEVKASALESIENLYPKSLTSILDSARDLDIERSTLEALERGDLKPSGGVIRHRGKELNKAEIPEAIDVIVAERKDVSKKLKAHDASCRRAYIQAAEELGQGWKEYLLSLIELLHCTEHMQALVKDENALLVNTWQVITADGQIGYFEKRRIISVCEKNQTIIQGVAKHCMSLKLPEFVKTELNINDWEKQCPVFNLEPVTKKNWPQWCEAASNSMNNISYVLGLISSVTLEELINTELKISEHLKSKTPITQAPLASQCSEGYPVLLPGDENVLQRKLDLWNRFQLAHGFLPTLARLVVSLGIVGGTIYSGFIG